MNTQPSSRPNVRQNVQLGAQAGARKTPWVAVIVAALIVAAALLWQAVTAAGNPDPLGDHVSPTAVLLDTGILVFREGLEAILVLAALTASLVRTEEGYWKPVALGAGLSLVATLATWFIMVGIIDSIHAPALEIQAVTGLIAIGVLMVLMNWFFHKVYWGGWIAMHTRRKRELTKAGATGGRTLAATRRGLILLGLTAMYREGFEVVLFLQSLRLKAGSQVVAEGALIGIGLTALVAFLTFVAHYKLPYRKMLVLTGILLGGVLLVMVGESVQELQLAGWCSTTSPGFSMPAWLGTWFAVFPNVEGIAAQLVSAGLVIGSYFLAKRVGRKGDGDAAGALDFRSAGMSARAAE